MKIEVLRIENLNTSFDGGKALYNLRLNVYEGEVLGVIGLNGSGKTTLVKVLSGLCRKDSGTIYFHSKAIDISNIRKARQLGIYSVQKDNMLIANLTVAQNIGIIKNKGLKNIILDERSIGAETEELLKRFSLDINPNTLASKLTEGEQRLIEVLKAYVLKARLIILDNIIELFSYAERKTLKKIIEELKVYGISFIITNYRLQEEMNMLDRAAVIRDGQIIKILHKEEFDKRLITNLCTGYEFKDFYKHIKNEMGETVLELHGISSGDALKHISLKVKSGEILGICDLEGHSSLELVKLISGQIKTSEGSIFIEGKAVNLNTIYDCINNGIGVVSERLFGKQYFKNITVFENLYFPIIKKLSGPLGYIPKRMNKFMLSESFLKFNFRNDNKSLETKFRSKAEEYKLLIGRWILNKSKVIVIDNITLGADIISSQTIYSMLNEACQNGAGVIFVTNDLSDIASICNRVHILKNGELQGDFIVGDETINLVREALI